MPEISDSDFRQFVAYQNLGTPQDIAKKVGELESDNKTQRDEIRDLKAKLPKETEAVLPKEKAEGILKEMEKEAAEDVKELLGHPVFDEPPMKGFLSLEPATFR